jgi:hypothetical protein
VDSDKLVYDLQETEYYEQLWHKYANTQKLCCILAPALGFSLIVDVDITFIFYKFNCFV